MTCQGSLFFLSGEEFGRTKNGIADSYNSPICINRLDWTKAYEEASLVEYYRGLDVYKRQEQTFRMEDCEKAEKADLVIVAVKYNGLSSAIETMKNCVGDSTIIMSVMNGISSEDRIAQQYGADKMIYTVAQGCLLYTSSDRGLAPY